MWYLIGMAVCLLIFILLPFIRFRTYWNQLLQDSDIKYAPIIRVIWEHAVTSIFECPTNYKQYKKRVIIHRDIDSYEMIISVAFLSFTILFWPITLFILLLVYFFNWSLRKIEQKIKQQIESERNE